MAAIATAAEPKFLLVSTIGLGSFGIVARADVEHHVQTFALKTISKTNHTAQEIDLLRREISICRGLTGSRGIVLTVHSYETPEALVVVQERALGDLFRVLKDDTKLSERTVRNIARQLASALDYLHNGQRITHRDLKPQNILLFPNARVALCDFGFARALGTNSILHTTIKGTPLYMAPELVQEMPYSFRVDIWSLGVILYELVTGEPPFFAPSLVELMKLIVRSPAPIVGGSSGGISPAFQDFLLGVLQKDPKHRLSWPALLHHEFLGNGEEEEAGGTAASEEEEEEEEGRKRLLELFPVRVVAAAAALDDATPPAAAAASRRRTPSTESSPSSSATARPMKRFLAKLYAEYPGAGGSSPASSSSAAWSEDAIHKFLGSSNESRLDFVLCVIDKVESDASSSPPAPVTAPSSSSQQQQLTLHLLRVSRKLVRAHALQLSSQDMQRLVLSLLKHHSSSSSSSSKLVGQALKFLDTFLYLGQYSAVLAAVVMSERESIVRAMLDDVLLQSSPPPHLHHHQQQLVGDVTHVLHVMLVSLGHPLGKQVNFYMTSATLHVFFQVLNLRSTNNSSGGGGDAEEDGDNTQYEQQRHNVLSVLLLSCSLVSGPLIQRLQHADWCGLLFALAFEAKLVPAVGLLECIARFCGSAGTGWAQRALAELLEDDVDFAYAHALAKLVLACRDSGDQGEDVPAEIPLFYLTAFPDEQAEAFFSLLLVASPRPCVTKLVWEACWKPATKHPVEALHALRCRRMCLEAAAAGSYLPSRKTLVDKLQALVRRELSPGFLALVLTSPRTHGGGVFGARRIFSQAVCLLDEMLFHPSSSSPSSLEFLTFLQLNHFSLVLECAVRLFANILSCSVGSSIDDALVLRRIASMLVKFVDTAPSPQHARKLCKHMMECKQPVDAFTKLWHADLDLGLTLYAHWATCGPVLLPGMERLLQDVPARWQQQRSSSSSSASLNCLLQVVSAICRKSTTLVQHNRSVKDVLRQLFVFLATTASDNVRVDDDCLALAIGNAAFHSDTFYPVLAPFVSPLVGILLANEEEEKVPLRARTNAALALGNLVRNGSHCDALIASTAACGAMLDCFDLGQEEEKERQREPRRRWMMEPKVVLVVLGNLASQEQCRARLTSNAKFPRVLQCGLEHINAEVRNAALRLAGKLGQQPPPPPTRM